MIQQTKRIIVLIAIAIGIFTLTALSTAFAQDDSQETLTTQDVLWVANGQDDNLSMINISTGEVLDTIAVGINPHILTISPDGSILYVINAGEHDRDPAAHGGTGDHGSATADDNTGGEHGSTMQMESGTSGNSLWALDSQTGEILAQIAVGAGPTHPIASSDGTRVYVTNTDGDSVSVIDTTIWEVITTFSNLPEPHDGELTPNGQYLYLATAGNNTMTVVETVSGDVLQTFEIGNKPRGLAVGGKNGEIVYITNKGDGSLSIINVVQDKIIGTYPVGNGAHALRVSPDGQRVYVALSGENAVALVDAVNGEVIDTIAVGDTPEQIDLSIDGRWLFASNFGDSTVSIIDLGQEAAVRTVAVGNGVYGIQATNVISNSQADVNAELSFAKNADGYAEISVQQLAEITADEANFTLINVHVPYAGEIPKTDFFIPFDQISANLNLLPDPDSPIVIYCRSGGMSPIAAKSLVEQGYSNVIEVQGGFEAWSLAGYELIENES